MTSIGNIEVNKYNKTFGKFGQVLGPTTQNQ